MKGWKKCLLYVLSFVLLLTASFTATSDSASAANANDAFCSSAVQPNFSGWLSFFSQSGYYYQTGGVYYVRKKPSGMMSNGFIRMNSSSTMSLFASTKPIELFKHSNGKYYANLSVNPSFNIETDLGVTPGTYSSSTTQSSLKGSQPPLSQQGATDWSWTGDLASRHYWSGVPTSPPANPKALTGGVDVGQGSEWWIEIYNPSSGVSAPCKKFGNVTYDASWDQATAGTTTVDNKVYPTTQGCSMTDIGCLLQQTFSTVANTFLAVGEAIVNGIASLFSPDVDTLKYSFDEFSNSLLDTLGFLAYPFEWIIDCLDALYGGIVADGSWSIGFCGIDSFDWGFETGTFFGSNININYCSTLVYKLTAVSTILFPVLISYALIRTFKHKIDEVHSK